MFMSNIMIQILLVLGVLTAGYFFLIRPQLRRITEHSRLLSSLKLGDQVVTGGGLIGTIVEFEGSDILGIELADTIRVHAVIHCRSEACFVLINNSTGRRVPSS